MLMDDFLLQMNYAIVYLVGILFFSMIFWYATGRKYYTGPIVEADLTDESVDRSSEDTKMPSKETYV